MQYYAKIIKFNSINSIFYVNNIINNMGYVSVNDFIINDTLKNNILMNNIYNKDIYNKVIDASEMIYDIKLLITGDETKIGQNGINISGGQKVRICLTRVI